MQFVSNQMKGHDLIRGRGLYCWPWSRILSNKGGIWGQNIEEKAHGEKEIRKYVSKNHLRGALII